MNEILTIAAEIRSDTGTSSARALRRVGKIPAIIYKRGVTPVHIAALEKEFTKLYREPFFTSTLLRLVIDKQEFKVLPKAVQLNPVTDVVRHIDFIMIDQDDSYIKARVPIAFTGRDRSLGLKRGGYLNIIKRSIELLCPTNAIPQEIECNISAIPVGRSIRVSYLKLPEGCKLAKTHVDYAIASILGKANKLDEEETQGEEKAENA